MDDFGLLKIMSPAIKRRIMYGIASSSQDDLYLDNILCSDNKNLFDESVTRFALHSSLSGVQPKVLATITDKATLKAHKYIIKSWGDEYKELALNEYYCMLAVKQANIPAPEFHISNDEKLFVMKRGVF